MSRIHLYIDEDSMHHALVTALRSLDIDVITAIEAGLIGRADEEHLEYAPGISVFYSPSMWGIFIVYIHSSSIRTGFMQGSFLHSSNVIPSGNRFGGCHT